MGHPPRRRCPASLCAARVAFVVLALSATTARAEHNTDGSVVWPFEGKVTSIVGPNGQGISVCCDIDFKVGSRVAGSFAFAPADAGYFAVTLALDSGLSETSFEGTGNGFGWARDLNAPMSDFLFAPGWVSSLEDVLHMRSDYHEIGNDWSLYLRDADGAVFDADGVSEAPRDLPLPPDYAPAIELFDTATLTFSFHLNDPRSCDAFYCPPNYGRDGRITVRIDRFPVPEPGPAALFGVALALLSARWGKRVRRPGKRS